MDLARFWWSDQAGPGGINNSLRFRGAQGLRQTWPSNTTNPLSVSFWLKTTNINNNPDRPEIINLNLLVGQAGIRINRDNEGRTIRLRGDDGTASQQDTAASFRDPNAWYHLFINSNGTDTTRLFVNGLEQVSIPTTLSIGTQVTFSTYLADGTLGTQHMLEGYLAEAHLVDGQELAPTDFAEFDANGVWVPTAYAGTYGVRGWRLDFSDPDDIGADRSGNGNDFTENGFELSNNQSGNYDHFRDSPTRNYCLFNPVSMGNVITNGDQAMGILDMGNTRLIINQVSGFSNQLSMGVRGSGVYYYEAEKRGMDNNSDGVGWVVADANAATLGIVWRDQGALWINGTTGPQGTQANISRDDWIGAELDLDNEVITFFQNGTQAFTHSIAGLADNNWVPGVMTRNATGDMTGRWNLITGGKPFNNNGRGQANVPETEHICTANLPAATIPNGRDHFRAITDTGANILTAAQTAFPNGLWWIKDRVNDNQHQLVSSVNGVTHAITSPETRSSRAYTAPAGDSVAWCWNCPDEFTPACSETLVSARRNAAAGFSMVRITGAHTTPADAQTFEHGLNAPPEFILTQAIIPAANTTSCRAWHSELNAGNSLYLNSNGSQVSEDVLTTTSTNNTLVNYLGLSGGQFSAGDIVFFNFAPVPGYSAFGSYEGNGDPDGPFIYTGFRPSWVMTKNISASGTNWMISDSTRSPGNPSGETLMANEPLGEFPNNAPIDILSNGFKVRSLALDNNSGTVIYAAFAENPFGGNNVSPANAR